MQHKRRGKREVSRRQTLAECNAVIRSELTDEQQLLALDNRPGNSERERARLSK